MKVHNQKIRKRHKEDSLLNYGKITDADDWHESFQEDERRAEVEVESRTVESETITKMPSEAITSGMSTAIVVRYVVWTSIERE